MKLRTIVEKHASAFGGNAELARAIGITLSGLLRGVKANRLSLEVLIRLADVTGENGVTVLRLGGQNEMADTITRVFGPSRQMTLTAGAVQERWSEIEAVMDRMKLDFVRALTAGEAAADVRTLPPAPMRRQRSTR